MKLLLSFLAAPCCIIATQAGAVSIGDTITCSAAASGGLICSSPSATVGPGVEFNDDPYGPFINFDFSNGLLTLTPASGPFSLASSYLFYIKFNDITNPFKYISLLSQTGTNLGISNVNLNNGVLTINEAEVTFSSSGKAVFSFLPPAVPEPSSWAMLLSGFGLIGVVMRRKPVWTRFA